MYFKDGARRNKVEEPLAVGLEYPVQWRELRVNLAESALLQLITALVVGLIVILPSFIILL